MPLFFLRNSPRLPLLREGRLFLRVLPLREDLLTAMRNFSFQLTICIIIVVLSAKVRENLLFLKKQNSSKIATKNNANYTIELKIIWKMRNILL